MSFNLHEGEHISSINNENGQTSGRTSGHGGWNLSLEKNDDGSWAVSGKEKPAVTRPEASGRAGRKKAARRVLEVAAAADDDKLTPSGQMQTSSLRSTGTNE